MALFKIIFKRIIVILVLILLTFVSEDSFSNNIFDKELQLNSSSQTTGLKTNPVLPWSYTNTEFNHIIFIPAGNITIGSVPIEIGDYIGIFHYEGLLLQCGGYMQWNGINSVVTAWGSEGGLDNGFQIGESFLWKVWKASNGVVFDMQPSYEPITYPFFQNGYFLPNGMSGIISLSCLTPPNISFGGLSNAYCETDSTVVLSGSLPGGIYTGQGITGNTFSPNLAGSGTHSITYTYQFQTGLTSTSTQFVTINESPVIDLGPDIQTCENYLTLNVGQINQIYWSTGESSQDIIALTTGLYSVTVTDINSCSNTDEIHITLLNNPQANINSFYELIPGQTIQIDADSGFVSYLWNDGSLSQSISTSYPGEFYIAIEDSNGCFGIDTTIVEFDLETSQVINIPKGWSYFSTYVNPYQSSIIDVFAPIYNDILLVKNHQGLVYWPVFNINLIGNHTVGLGYQIQTSNATTLTIQGLMVVPEWTPLTIPAGWSLLGYLRNSPADITQIIDPILLDMNIIKDFNGFFYWPTFNINTIGDMSPGEGYLISMNQGVVFTYPWNGSL